MLICVPADPSATTPEMKAALKMTVSIPNNQRRAFMLVI
jgi:hypothetical protein